MTKTITIGGILSLIGAIALLFWAIGFVADFSKNPTSPKNTEVVAEKMADEATPPQALIMIKLAPYGVGGSILIILLVLFWDKIMNYKTPIS